MSKIFKKIIVAKNQLFYGRDISPLHPDFMLNRETLASSTYTQLNIYGEKDDLSNDPFYGDKAIKRRIDMESNHE